MDHDKKRSSRNGLAGKQYCYNVFGLNNIYVILLFFFLPDSVDIVGLTYEIHYKKNVSGLRKKIDTAVTGGLGCS